MKAKLNRAVIGQRVAALNLIPIEWRLARRRFEAVAVVGEADAALSKVCAAQGIRVEVVGPA